MIQVEQLRFRYQGQQQDSIKDISFAVEPGEIFGFLGPSGAGKSTTQKILIKLLQHYQGQVQLLGKELRQWDHRLFEQVGVGFELPNHYAKLTARENLQFFASFYACPHLRTEELLRRTGLEPDANKPLSQFSKGMRMRLNFVRALMHRPKLLFLDEPMSGLDPGNARILKDLLLEEKARGTTIFITTHSMPDAEELCDRVAFMVEGALVLIDSPQALKLRYGQPRLALSTLEHPQPRYFDLQQLGQNQAFLNILQTETVQTLHSQEAHLEEIFLLTTGKKLQG
jgi:fluoroquinolone transport system ATP-binding protein